jgi:hypothetical protein
MNQLYPLRRTRDFGQTISDTIQFLKAHWKNLVILYLVFVVPFLLVATLLGADSLTSFVKLLGVDSRQAGISKIWGVFTPEFMIAILMYFISAVSYATVIFIYMRLFEEGGGVSPKISDVGAIFFNRFLSNAGYMVFLFIGLLMMAFLAIVPILGILLFLFGSIYMFVSTSILFQINTIENNPFLQSFTRMFFLIRNNWWYTFGVLIILGLIYYFFSAVIGLVFNLIFGIGAINFLDTKSGFAGMDKKYFLVMGFSSIFQQIFMLIVYTGLGIHYFSLREQKDGSGLEARIEQLGSGGNEHGHIEEQY